METKLHSQKFTGIMLKFFALTVLLSAMIGISLIFGMGTDFVVTENATAAEYKSTLPKITINDRGSAGVFITCNFKNLILSPIYVEGERYLMPHIFGFSHIETIGSPRLPVRNLPFAVPYGAKPVIKILDATYKDFTKKQAKIHPALAPHPDCYNCPEPEFELDPAVYETNALFPKTPVQIISHDTFMAVPMAIAQVRPIQYNPVTGKFRVFSMLKFKVEFAGGEGSFARFSKHSSHTNRMVKRAVLNGNSIPLGVSRDRLDTRATGKDYIIITHSDYLTQANALANWKRQLGYSVEVVSQSSWTSSQIDDALKTRYNSWSPKPLYFLIIGDENTAPPEDTGPRDTDLYYAEMDGSGWKPEMAYGRLPVSSTNEAATVVEKIIDYEKNPPTLPGFYTNAMTAAMYQDTDNYDSYADRRFCHTSEDIRNYLMSQGYTVNRVYATGSSGVDPIYYNNGYYSPSGMQIPGELQRPNFDWEDDAADINDSINAGRFLVSHRDHGSTTLWGDPYYTTAHIDQLGNSSLLPVVFSVNCLTGKYVTATECFAEKFLTRSGGGCVGIFAATEISYSGYNDGYACGAMDAIWPDPGMDPQIGSGGAGGSIPAHDAIYTMGDVLNQAKQAMIYLWSDSQITWELHHYYGDPAMKIWTAAPTTATAAHPASISAGSTSLSITGSNCAGGIATLVYEDTLVGKTALDGSGVGSITFAALSGSETTAILTVSKHNYKPYVAHITVETGPPQPPVANFSGNPTSVGQGGSVAFTDLSANLPTTWTWTFEGGTPSSSTARNPTVTYDTTGTYTVTLTATNSAGSDTETKVDYITVNEVVIVEMFVYDITQDILRQGKKYKSKATVTIWDTEGSQVSGAAVTITWSGVVGGTAQGTSAADGTVIFESDKVKSTGPFTITVDNVTHATLPYNSSLNIETSDTASY